MLLAATACAVSSPSQAANLLIFGDSLSAGYGIDLRLGWVALLDKRLTDPGDPAMEGWSVINASVSGETTAEGLERLPEALARTQPSMVLIELGGNDGLRGYPIEDIQGRLERMVEQIRRAHAQPILMEIKIPDVFGPAYSRRFNQIYTDVAKSEQVPLLTFFLAPIIDDRARWFQEDGIHPNAAAQPLLLESVWSSLSPVLRKFRSIPARS